MRTPVNPWLVFYTKARHEKKVRDLLLRRGFDVFLPMQKVFRQWSDRKKKVEVPLFNSYIFVSVPYHKVEEVLQVPGVAWAIRHNGKPAELRPREYDIIVRFIDTGLLIEDLPADAIEIGEHVEVMDGPLKGLIGQVEGKGSGKFIVVLQALGRAMRVEVNPLVVKKIGTNESRKSKAEGRKSRF